MKIYNAMTIYSYNKTDWNIQVLAELKFCLKWDHKNSHTRCLIEAKGSDRTYLLFFSVHLIELCP